MDILSFLLGVLSVPIALVVIGVVFAGGELLIHQFKTNWQLEAERYKKLYEKEVRKNEDLYWPKPESYNIPDGSVGV